MEAEDDKPIKVKTSRKSSCYKSEDSCNIKYFWSSKTDYNETYILILYVWKYYTMSFKQHGDTN